MDGKKPKLISLPMFTRSSIPIQGSLLLIGTYWFFQVAKHVPEPYLDEVFHVRQAKAYWDNQWRVWDPKITTPPGLYVVSYVWLWLLNVLRIPGSLTVQLRGLNLGAGVWSIFYISRRLLYNASNPAAPRSIKVSSLFPIDHGALNICLFPPLFFFYGVYYTDVLSAELILLAYAGFQERNKTKMILASLLALAFRQTNIFWVAVYFGGLEVLWTLKRGRQGVYFPARSSFSDVVVRSWQTGCLYDLSVSKACFEDYLKCCISLVLVSLANLQAILYALIPYLFLLSLFTTFVLWNGGVVLGDKANHTASIHLPQMLYIWPYITFFSLPLLTPHYLALLPQHRLPRPLRSPSSSRTPLPRLIVSLPILLIMAVVVHYNTLVHPFTLADNRHYTFYVFRLLLRHPSVKYLVVPIYFITAWAAITALGGLPEDTSSAASIRFQARPTRFEHAATSNTISSDATAATVLIYLIATSLSLITAPLVEPRYFIVPWLLWRLQIPTSKSASPVPAYQQTPRHETKEGLLAKYRLSLETIWFLLINGVTGYIFLHWGFAWPQEEGKVQRFMW